LTGAGIDSNLQHVHGLPVATAVAERKRQKVWLENRWWVLHQQMLKGSAPTALIFYSPPFFDSQQSAFITIRRQP